MHPPSLFSVHLNELVFEARHGVYPSEKINAGTFRVDVTLGLSLKDKVARLCDTVDYAQLYMLISGRMNKPTPLLETLAQDIAELLLKSDERIRSVTIRITKCNPPIPDFRGSVSVSHSMER